MMDHQSTTILTISATALVSFIRNNMVYGFRNRILDDYVFGIGDGFGFKKRLEIFDRVSYAKMFLQFWKDIKLKAFYSPEEIDILIHYRE